jgi:hypothetical protein
MNVLDIQRLIHRLPVADAITELAKHGYTLRVVREEGRDCVCTCDVNTKRVNVEVVCQQIHTVLGLG